MNVVLAPTYPSRIAAIKTLISQPQYAGGGALRARAKEVSAAAELFGKAEAGKNWRYFATSLEILGFLADWCEAVHTASLDADRFKRAARLRYRTLAEEAGSTVYGEMLVAALAPIGADPEIEMVSELRAAVVQIELPVAMFSIEDKNDVNNMRIRTDAADPEEIAVAFLEFTIDGKGAETFHSLTAGQVHDLDLTIRVSRWPEGSERLVIAPISIEPASTWDFPTFEFARPEGAPPYLFQRQGRMTLHTAQGFNARPLEFRYAAEFQPQITRGEAVVVAGQRTLRLDGTDTSRHPLTGYGEIDAKIIQIRERLRLEPLIAEADIRDLLELLTPVGNLMGQTVQDKRYPKPIDEKTFQIDFQAFLRANSAIGSELEVQGQVAGGRVDLTFRGIRIELKSERSKRLLPDDCKQFAEQAASYGVGGGRRLSLLCVLDSSVKFEAPFPVADGLTVIPVDTGTSPVYVVSCLFQGGLSRPSDLSR